MTKIPKTNLCEIVNTSTLGTPAKAGVHNHLKRLGSGVRRNDGTIKFWSLNIVI